ncbi:hypothetical protein ACFSLT_15690 [Novosphingobium resinovorum]
MKAAQPLQKAMEAAIAALGGQQTPEAMAKAKAAFDGAVGGDGKAAFQAAVPTATTPDDKNALGSMMRNFGIISQDLALKQEGNKMLLGSGKLPAEEVGKTNYDAGITAYQLKDYASAATYLKAAKDGGFVDRRASSMRSSPMPISATTTPRPPCRWPRTMSPPRRPRARRLRKPRCARSSSRPTPPSSSRRRPNMRRCSASITRAPGTPRSRWCASWPRCRATRTST